MYYTERDPFSGKPLFVEKNLHKKALQKQILTGKSQDHTFPINQKVGGQIPRDSTRQKNK
jgi:hypothetical protein